MALVAAAPPSYTRMYHYFPAHLPTHPYCFYPQPPQPPPPPPPQLPPALQALPPTITQLPAPPTLKQLGNSLSSMTQAHIAQTLRYPGKKLRNWTLFYLSKSTVSSFLYFFHSFILLFIKCLVKFILCNLFEFCVGVH